MTTLRPYSPLKAALDDASLTATEHQLHLASVLGRTPRWRLLNNGTAEFITTSGLIITARIHPIGVLQNKVWTWAWADDRITEPRRHAVNQIREFGKHHNIQVLTRPSFDLGDWRTLITPTQLVTAPKIIHQIWRHFVFTMPDGAALFAGLSTPDIPLPPATEQGVAQTLRTAPTLVPITKKRRALVSYANLRSITRQERRTASTMRLHTPSGSLDVDWSKENFHVTPAPGRLSTPDCDNHSHDNTPRPSPQ